MNEDGVDGHVTVLCLIIYLGHRVSLAIWHTEFDSLEGCPGDLLSSFKLRTKQCCPKSSFLTSPFLGCMFLWTSKWKGPSRALRGWHQSHQSWFHAIQRIPVLADSAHHWCACLCTLTAGLGNLIKMCLLWIIVQSSSERERERETVMVLSDVNKNEVCEGPSYSCQNLIFSTFCFRSVKPNLANLSGKFSNEVQVCFVVDIANKSKPPWFHQWRTRSAILIGVNHPYIISVIKI